MKAAGFLCVHAALVPFFNFVTKRDKLLGAEVKYDQRCRIPAGSVHGTGKGVNMKEKIAASESMDLALRPRTKEGFIVPMIF